MYDIHWENGNILDHKFDTRCNVKHNVEMKIPRIRTFEFFFKNAYRIVNCLFFFYYLSIDNLVAA